MRGREEIRAAQRKRLTLAMVDAIGEHGYRATRVADVIARAGVSRKTFYENFANKQECFLATYEEISARAIERAEQAYRGSDRWPESAATAIRALVEGAIENPAAVRLILVEINALGAAGIERRDRSTARYERAIRGALELPAVESKLSETVLRSVVGGLNRVLARRVLRGEREALLALVPDLTRWATSYYPARAPILTDALEEPGRAELQALTLEGGRAPGTLAPHPPMSARRGLRRGDQNVSRSYVVHSQRERILDAVANLTAADGYAELKVEKIAEQAAVSLNAFYEHFADKEDAFLVAYELGHGKALASVERAYIDAGDWRLGVRAGLAALFRFLAAEPAFAHLALLDALTATAYTAERSTLGIDAFAAMLVPGLDQVPRRGGPPPVTIEAIAGGVFDICLHYALQGRIRELPELTPAATYIALTPFIGGEEAARVAIEPAAVARGAELADT